MKIVHVAQLMVGRAFPEVHACAGDLRAARQEVVRTVNALADAEKAVAVVLSGNVFADNLISAEQVEELAEELTVATVPVYVLPGPLDPATADSPFRRQADLWPEHVRVLTAEPVEVAPGVQLVPLPCRSTDVGFREPEGVAQDGWRVAVCHPRGLDEEREIVQLLGGLVDDVVSGTSHEGGGLDAPPPVEPFDFDHGMGRVEILERREGATVRRRRSVGHYRWHEVSARADKLDELEQKLAGVREPLKALVRVRLQGTLTMASSQRLAHMVDANAHRFLHIEWQDATGLDATVEHAFSSPLVRQMARGLFEASAESTADGDDVRRIAAQRALRWLSTHTSSGGR